MDTENQVYVFVCDRLLKTGHYFLKFYDKPLAPSKSANWKVLTFHFSQKNIRDVKNLTQMHRYLVKLKITPLIAIGKWHNTLGTHHTSNFFMGYFCNEYKSWSIFLSPELPGPVRQLSCLKRVLLLSPSADLLFCMYIKVWVTLSCNSWRIVATIIYNLDLQRIFNFKRVSFC